MFLCLMLTGHQTFQTPAARHRTQIETLVLIVSQCCLCEVMIFYMTLFP